MEIRKVRGEVNPADLFTKHLSSEERVTSLMRLFGCRFATGRAQEAPQLRRDVGVRHTGVLACEVKEKEKVIIQDGYAYNFTTLDEADGQRVPEAYLHDETVLPHQIRGDLAAVFPRALAASEPVETVEPVEALESRGIRLGRSGRFPAVNPTLSPPTVSPARCLARVDGEADETRIRPRGEDLVGPPGASDPSWPGGNTNCRKIGK